MIEKPTSTVETTQQYTQEQAREQPSWFQFGLEPRVRSRRWTHQLAIALYKLGHSARDVGELLDLPRGTVSGLVTKAGVSRGRDDAVRLALRHRQVRTNVAHVTLLGDVVVDVAAKLGITADLLLAVLADRLHSADHVTSSTTTRVTDRRPGHGDDDIEPVASGLSCVDVCSFGCTHRCARSTAPIETAG